VGILSFFLVLGPGGASSTGRVATGGGSFRGENHGSLKEGGSSGQGGGRAAFCRGGLGFVCVVRERKNRGCAIGSQGVGMRVGE